jgi:hypothetical protein
LAEAEERMFEREVLSLLHVMWPSLQQAPARGSWDQRGIDLITWADDGEFECAVQCKGFLVRELGSDQLRQVIDSIRVFGNSRQTVGTYLLVHNRDQRFKEFNQKVEQELAALVQSGCARRAMLWDRDTLLEMVFDSMERAVKNRIHEDAKNRLEQFQRVFEFGAGYIAGVPFSQQELVFRRYEPCRIQSPVAAPVLTISDAIIEKAPEHRWTMLTGNAGMGKTTTLLNVAAGMQDRTTIVVRAAELDASNLKYSTSRLMEEIVASLDMVGAVEPLDYAKHREIAGAVLSKMLRVPDSKYVLVIDGLDENRTYADTVGLEILNNQLADFQCEIVLSTRTEHLFTMFGGFSTAFQQLGAKNRSTRTALLITLDQWATQTVIDFVQRAIDVASGDGRHHLQEFATSLLTGEYQRWYGDLPVNPLFLQFMLEDISENGVRQMKRTSVIQSWIERKIRRDCTAANRLPLWDLADVEEKVASSIELMEHIAFLMTENSGDLMRLVEVIDAETIRTTAQQHFQRPVDTILRIVLNSLLVPTSARVGNRMKVSFIFRVAQEYLLARYLVRVGEENGGYPPAVRDFCLEISYVG